MERRSKHGRIGIVSVIQIALFALMLAFAFGGPLMTPARAATTYYVNIVDFAFSPATVTIQPGDSVQWNDTVSTDHTSTSDTTSTEVWDSGILTLGQTYTHQFNNAGSFSYHCSVHSTMHGTVIVGAIPEFSSLAFVMIGLMVLVVGLSVVIRRR
jgi:plastocyanin